MIQHPTAVKWDATGKAQPEGITCIIGDSMVRGPEFKQHFYWCDVKAYEDLEALAIQPPSEYTCVYYVTSGNALCKHAAYLGADALANIKNEAFNRTVAGVVLLGSPELWKKMYGASTSMPRNISNPGFFDDVEAALREGGVPVIRLCDDVVTNLEYTDDLHPVKGPPRFKLAKHIEDSLRAMTLGASASASANASWAAGGDSWSPAASMQTWPEGGGWSPW